MRRWILSDGGGYGADGDFFDPELVKIMGQVFAAENRVKR
jgi:hypothetical protein